MIRKKIYDLINRDRNGGCGGVGIIALPSGVITASYLEELREHKARRDTACGDRRIEGEVGEERRYAERIAASDDSEVVTVKRKVV